MNPLVEQYARHARRFGDPRSAFEAAERDRLLSAADLGYLVARVRDLKPTAEGAYYWQGDGHRQRVKWPGFRLTPREKDEPHPPAPARGGTGQADRQPPPGDGRVCRADPFGH